MAAPTIAVSEIGVSMTRASPKRSLQPLGDLERAAVGADVLAEHEHALVARHLLEERLADRLEIGDDGHRQPARERRLHELDRAARRNRRRRRLRARRWPDRASATLRPGPPPRRRRSCDMSSMSSSSCASRCCCSSRGLPVARDRILRCPRRPAAPSARSARRRAARAPASASCRSPMSDAPSPARARSTMRLATS